MELQAIPDSGLLIAHIGDTHLRDTQYATYRRGLDFFEGFMKAIQIGCEHADVIVLTGDIFDRPRPSPKVIGQLMQADQLIKRSGKVAFAITGNHDWGSPTWLQTLFPGRLESSDNADAPAVEVDATGIIPLDNAAALYKGYRFVGLTPHSAATFRGSLADITVRARNADVVLFHGLVTGVVDFFAGTESPLHVSEFPVSKNNKAWLLGDVHVQGFVSVDRPGGGKCLVGYPGSTEMCSASENPDKSVPIIRLSKESATVQDIIPFSTRPFIKAEVCNDEQLDTLMARLAPVADQHPVVVVQFDRKLSHAINRIHSMLDAQRAVIRCYPLPEVKEAAERQHFEDDSMLGIDHFISRRFAGNDSLEKVALDLLNRGDSDANNILAGMIEERLAVGVREDD